jgi:hypothetical protein
MRTKLFLPLFRALAIWMVLVASPCRATIISFDDFLDTHAGGGTLITNAYQGLVWSNFAVANAVLLTVNSGLSGAYYGMLSPSNVAVNAHGDPAEIVAGGTNFNFASAYLTGVWRSNLNVEAQGFRGGDLLYDQTVVISAANPTFFVFNYLNVDRLAFNAFGGEYAGLPAGGDGTVFAMDDLAFEFVPEPSSFLLTAAGALTLYVFLKRRRV